MCIDAAGISVNGYTAEEDAIPEVETPVSSETQSIDFKGRLKQQVYAVLRPSSHIKESGCVWYGIIWYSRAVEEAISTFNYQNHCFRMSPIISI